MWACETLIYTLGCSQRSPGVRPSPPALEHFGLKSVSPSQTSVEDGSQSSPHGAGRMQRTVGAGLQKLERLSQNIFKQMTAEKATAKPRSFWQREPEIE